MQAKKECRPESKQAQKARGPRKLAGPESMQALEACKSGNHSGLESMRAQKACGPGKYAGPDIMRSWKSCVPGKTQAQKACRPGKHESQESMRAWPKKDQCYNILLSVNREFNKFKVEMKTVSLSALLMFMGTGKRNNIYVVIIDIKYVN